MVRSAGEAEVEANAEADAEAAALRGGSAKTIRKVKKVASSVWKQEYSVVKKNINEQRSSLSAIVTKGDVSYATEKFI